MKGWSRQVRTRGLMDVGRGGGKDAAQAVERAGMVDNEGGGHACKSGPFFVGRKEAVGGGGGAA